MDPHSFSKLDPDLDPHLLEKLDPDPHKVNADPKHCSNRYVIFYLFQECYSLL
jgi:hypothetical protein